MQFSTLAVLACLAAVLVATSRAENEFYDYTRVPRSAARARSTVANMVNLRVFSKRDAASVYTAAERWLTEDNVAELRNLYRNWKQQYNITYGQSEDAERFALFKHTLSKIVATNKDSTKTYWGGLNKFAATPFSEFKSTYLRRSPKRKKGTVAAEAAAADASSSTRPRADLPLKKDWSRGGHVVWNPKGFVSPPKDQGEDCGSCWSFAAIGAIESAWLIQSGTRFKYFRDASGRKINLSEQQIVNCCNEDTGYDFSEGCDGGDEADAMGFASEFYITTEANLPYEGDEWECDDPSSFPPQSLGRLQKPGYIDGFTDSAQDFMETLQDKPTVVGMALGDELESYYAGGVFNGGCDVEVNHAVVLVGYNAEADPPYWIIKNSFGREWGMNGYFLMQMDEAGPGHCQMYDSNTQPTWLEKGW